MVESMLYVRMSSVGVRNMSPFNDSNLYGPRESLWKIFYLQLISQPLTLNNFDHLVSGNWKGQEHSHDSLEIETRVHCNHINRNKLTMWVWIFSETCLQVAGILVFLNCHIRIFLSWRKFYPSKSFPTTDPLLPFTLRIFGYSSSIWMKYFCFFHIMNNDCFEYCGGKAITLFLILTLLQKYALQKFKIHIFLISSTFSKEMAFFSELWYPFLRTYPFLRGIYGIGWSQVRICGNYACFKVLFFFKKLHTLLGGHLNDALSTPYQNTNIYIAV